MAELTENSILPGDAPEFLSQAEPAPAELPAPQPPAQPEVEEDTDASGWWALLWIGVVCLLLFGAVAFGALGWAQGWGRVPFGAPGKVQVEIPHGTTAAEVARTLARKGVVANAPRFMVWLRLRGDWTRLQAGDYEFTLPVAPEAVAKVLAHGSFDRKVTFPEGWTTAQIGRRLAEQGWIKDAALWDQAAAAAVTLPDLNAPLPTGPLGYCFPETYRFPREAAPSQILDGMLREFAKIWRSIEPDKRDPRSAALTMQEVVTLASIVEREARAKSEMPAIASVYLNRLQKNMKLQCCATVRYALGGVWDRPLSYADLKVDNPYNTYKVPGLPPGPIANPGRLALEAVLRPAPENFLFYVYAGNNRHIFSKTGKEHEAAVRRIRKMRKQGEVIEFKETE